MRTTFSSFAILLVTFVFAQKEIPAPTDYIVLGDTARKTGIGNFDMEKGDLMFQLKFSSLKKAYDPSQVSEFKIDNHLYKSLEVDGSLVFMEVLEEGEISVYRGWEFYLLKSSDRDYIATEQNFETVLNSIYGQRCNWEGNRKRLLFTRGFFKHLVSGYNRKNCFRVQQSPFGVRLFTGASSAKVPPAANNVLNQDIEFTNSKVVFGVWKEFPLYKKKSIVTSLDYISYSELFNDDRYELVLDQSFLVIGLSPRLYFGRLFFEGGLNTLLYLSDNSSLTFDNEGFEVALNKFGAGYRLGTGFRIPAGSTSIDLLFNIYRFAGPEVTYSYQHFGLALGF